MMGFVVVLSVLLMLWTQVMLMRSYGVGGGGVVVVVVDDGVGGVGGSVGSMMYGVM